VVEALRQQHTGRRERERLAQEAEEQRQRELSSAVDRMSATERQEVLMRLRAGENPDRIINIPHKETA
jgi:hypothetical protein